ncbi:hypothetical protein BDV27DRAFT_149141 [Aspergillus caelatus]|uniref:Methyltransferase domain-containing protein n=1 Tax=Aspergillus caelatus TaxID=61420 RepID=A0A5N6ZUJ4_9EURO|nr:uncharacterized protein BDV27DRAFT_149141 [Aspergillus caelatus]KAE8359930.1 hypothetical protein BDV27DRAFT_149141 [Aspergillus caelatus]
METILSSFLHDPTSALKTQIFIPRFIHRLRMAEAWGISSGERILDTGCGQGGSSLILAHLVGPNGRITGIDPVQPEYGTPFAVQQSQEYTKRSTLGSSLTFLRTDAPSFVHGLDCPASEVFDAAVLCHSLWYFQNRLTVYHLFRALRDADIPCVYLWLDQESTLKAVQLAGFLLKKHGSITPESTILEGHYEVQYVAEEKFTRVVREEGLPETQQDEILAWVTRVRKSNEELKLAGLGERRYNTVNFGNELPDTQLALSFPIPLPPGK